MRSLKLRSISCNKNPFCTLHALVFSSQKINTFNIIYIFYYLLLFERERDDHGRKGRKEGMKRIFVDDIHKGISRRVLAKVVAGEVVCGVWCVLCEV